MAITSINGTSWDNITSISGTAKSSVRYVGGIETPSGVSCTTVYFGYSDGRRSAPTDACTADVIPYELDTSTMILYQVGQCGGATAAPGFYSDGGTLYDYTNGTLNEIGPCR